MTTCTTSTVLSRLDADWTATVTSSRARRALRSWQTNRIHGLLLAPFADLQSIVDTLHAGAGDDNDPLLASLIDLGRDDETAARVVLQAFVPLAVNLSTFRRGDGEYLSDVISVLAEMIATFPLDTHCQHVAGHLAFMVRRKLHRRHRRCHLDTVSIDDDAVAAVVDIRHGRSLDARTAADRVADIVAGGRATGIVNDDQARLLLLVAAGHKVAELARHAGCHRSNMGARLAKATVGVSAAAIAA